MFFIKMVSKFGSLTVYVNEHVHVQYMLMYMYMYSMYRNMYRKMYSMYMYRYSTCKVLVAIGPPVS
jgi:hypothetical protein